MIKNIEAKAKKEDDNRAKILGVGVNSTSAFEVLTKIEWLCKEKSLERPYFIITAYSENVMEAARDKELAKAFCLADLVVPDGVSVVAAMDYLTKRKNAGGEDLWLGLSEGWKILRGGFADKKVEGVELTRKLLRAGGEKGWRIFLLGGWYGVGEKLVKMMRRDFPGIEIISDAGRDDIRPQVDKEIIDRINVFRPDILLVAFGRFRQEKWIAANLKHLKTKVVMGVGSSFDELAGVGPWAWPTPKWVGRMGLKWLWRAVIDPRHIKRAWNAFPCFAWKVFRSKSRD